MFKTLILFLALMMAPAAMAAEFDTPTCETQTMQTDQTETDTLDYAQLDAGIRETVRWLRSEGYHTCDSGDGSKAETMECALDKPMVVVQVSRDELAQACDDIAHALTERGIKLSAANTDGVWIQGSYDPTQSMLGGVIVLIGLDDQLLAAHPQPENITRRGAFEPSNDAAVAIRGAT